MTASALRSEVVWHDAECGAYGADLDLWQELAREIGGPIVELGAGTGRVALHLAARGHAVDAVEADPELLAALGERARRRRLAVRPLVADIAELPALPSAALMLAPMQVLQLLSAERRRLTLRRGFAVLRPGGVLAAAVVEGAGGVGDAGPGLLPDVAERDEWVYSSLPLDVCAEDNTLVVRRLRQLVSPSGELSEHVHEQRLAILAPGELAEEGRAAGFEVLQSRPIPATDDHLGSTVVMLERPR